MRYYNLTAHAAHEQQRLKFTMSGTVSSYASDYQVTNILSTQLVEIALTSFPSPPLSRSTSPHVVLSRLSPVISEESSTTGSSLTRPAGTAQVTPTMKIHKLTDFKDFTYRGQ